MVAFNVPVFGGQRMPSLAMPLLYAAHDDLKRGHEIAAAAKVRVALCRYLTALCELHNCLPRRRHTASRLMRALQRAGCDGCFEYLEEIIESCDAVLRCEKPGCSIKACVEIAADLIDTRIDERDGDP
ncbi:hypothetical protein KOR34_24390 [Posidoniimonas corsicana]|uniref:HEPN domain protein n=1 Tax=Posidoniimonas corsicana TaxID=1938618 RepID=A0A5C5VHM6_9BACT|nr:hypothetical protein [Posidoniimonas corsicana]TWT37487.1 hypothetical protein KOR34_24390 [Posidoniimonas corsicana]